MDYGISFTKLKILFINIFGILYKAATLNVFKLHSELIDVRHIVDAAREKTLLSEVLTLLISTMIVLRFVLGFVGLAAGVVAVYPILTNVQPELLMPTIVTQSIDNVVLNVCELPLGFLTVKYLQPHNMPFFAVFVTKLVIKTSLSIAALNIFSEFYNSLAPPPPPTAVRSRHLEPDSSEEFEIANQNLD